MLTYEQAERLAAHWVDVVTAGRAVLQLQHTIERPYGWVFFYQSRRWIETRQTRDALFGNAPIIVNAVRFEIRVTGTGRPIEDYLAVYEATLPPALLKGVPGRRRGEGGPTADVNDTPGNAIGENRP